MTRRCSISFLSGLFLLFTVAVSASQRRVPGDYATIQAAVEASANGDMIVIAEGTYHERIEIAKGIILTSSDPSDPSVAANTIIDAGGSGSAIKYSEEIATDGEIRGLTITGGSRSGVDCQAGNLTVSNCIVRDNGAYSGSGKGGGMFNGTANLTVIDSLFIGNTASGYGGGIFSDQGVLTVIGCEFIGNSAQYEGGGIGSDYEETTVRDCLFVENDARYGGGIHNSHYAATVENCTFAFNIAQEEGGGLCEKDLYLGDQTVRIRNCTFYDNVAYKNGGGVCVRSFANMIMSNCILWYNMAYEEGPQMAAGHDGGNMSVSYCCIEGGQGDVYPSSATLDWGQGNFDANPRFADAASEDFHLESVGGRWDVDQETWVVDNTHSPCIDTGDPASDWALEVWPNAQRINIGAFGGTAEASKSETTGGNTILAISSTTGGSVNIPGEGSFDYAHGNLVAIEATAGADYRFVRWTGTAVDSDKVADPLLASTSVTMDGNYSLQANFQPVVPDVVGMTQTNAAATIAAIDSLTVSVSTTYSDTVATGVVLSQDPVGGTAVPAGSTVSIVVSLGNIADIDSSGSVDENDLSRLTEKWLSTEDSLCENLNGDEIVNLKDLAILLDNWGWKQ